MMHSLCMCAPPPTLLCAQVMLRKLERENEKLRAEAGGAMLRQVGPWLEDGGDGAGQGWDSGSAFAQQPWHNRTEDVTPEACSHPLLRH